jgi:hypothetical protein
VKFVVYRVNIYKILKYELLFEEPFLSNVTKKKNKILRFPYQQSVKVRPDEFL